MAVRWKNLFIKTCLFVVNSIYLGQIKLPEQQKWLLVPMRKSHKKKNVCFKKRPQSQEGQEPLMEVIPTESTCQPGSVDRSLLKMLLCVTQLISKSGGKEIRQRRRGVGVTVVWKPAAATRGKQMAKKTTGEGRGTKPRWASTEDERAASVLREPSGDPRREHLLFSSYESWDNMRRRWRRSEERGRRRRAAFGWGTDRTRQAVRSECDWNL